MVRTDKLRGLIRERGYRYEDVAGAIGITPKTFGLKMKKGVFGSDEMETMIEFLDIDDPAAIFFAKE